MPPPLPMLPDELLEEIFLRVRLHERASLRRAEVASKFWHGLLTGPAFCGKYRQLHGEPPNVYGPRSCRTVTTEEYHRLIAQRVEQERRRESVAWELREAATRCSIARRQAPPSRKHHLQAPSRNVATQPVSHKRGTAAPRDDLNTLLKKKHEMIRKIQESRKELAVVQAKIDALGKDAQRKGRPM